MPSSLGQYKGTDISPGTQEEIIAQIASIDATAPKAVSAYTVNDLSTTPRAIALPSAPIPSASSAFQGEMEAFTKGLAEKAEQSKADKDASGTAYANALFNSDTELNLADDLYKKPGGVDETKAELDDVNAQLLQEQEGLRREIETIENNAEGLTRTAVLNKVDEARRRSLRTQADLAVIQLARQGKYDSAKAVADRAVAMQLERQKQKLDVLRFIYEENKEQFSKDEARAFETAQKERERMLQNEEYRLRAEFDQKIKQSDPLYQLEIAYKQKQMSLLGQPTPKELKEQQDALKEAQASLPIMRDKIGIIDALKSHPGKTGTVGPYKISRWTPLSPDKSDRQEFIGSVQKLVNGLTLDNLIEAKKRGATFGALSEGELSLLASSASAINSWALKDDNGQVYGYSIGETQFDKELENIRRLTQRAILQSGGSLISTDELSELKQVLTDAAPFDPSSFFNSQSTSSF